MSLGRVVGPAKLGHAAASWMRCNIGEMTYCVCLPMYSVAHCDVYNMVKAGDDAVAKLDTELRRGAVVLAVLSQLRTAQYGLRQALAQRGMPIEEGTLYPLLRRLEEQGLLASDWRINDGPPRRFTTN